LSENLLVSKEIQRVSQDNRLSATVVANATNFHVFWIATGSFVLGMAFLFVLELIIHFHL
jgi:hypothetical protein